MHISPKHISAQRREEAIPLMKFLLTPPSEKVVKLTRSDSALRKWLFSAYRKYN